jgi:hypothetical protein
MDNVFMVCRNLCQGHLLEVDMMQILADHVNGTPFGRGKKNPHIYMVMGLGSCVKVDFIVVWLVYLNPASLH